MFVDDVFYNTSKFFSRIDAKQYKESWYFNIVVFQYLKMKVLTWLNICALFPFLVQISSSAKVPAIDGCQYIDADSVECWWTRLQNDSTSTYRLSYFREVDPHYQRIRRICQPTKEHTYFKNTKQYCTISNATPFARYNFSVSVMCGECEDPSCICSDGSFYLFECDPTNVLLQTPPDNLKLESPHNQLTWLPPSKPHSMLSYVRDILTTEYKLEYKVMIAGTLLKKSEWKVWFIGNSTSFHVPTLISGAQYAARVSARLIPLHVPDYRIWSPPSKTLTFFGNIQSSAPLETTLGTSNYGNESILPTQPRFVGSSEQTSTSHIAVAVSVSAISLVLLAVVFYNVLYRLLGCNKSKQIPKPVVMVEMDTLDGKNVGMYGNYENFDEEAEIYLSSALLPGTQLFRQTSTEPIKCGLAETIISQVEHESFPSKNNIWKLSKNNDCSLVEQKEKETNVDVHRNILLVQNSSETHLDNLEDIDKPLLEPSPPTVRTVLVPATNNSTSEYDFSVETHFSAREEITSNHSDENSFYSTNMEYVMSNVTSPEIEYVEMEDQCSCSTWSKRRSSSGSTEILPDYVKQAKGNQQIELFLAITSETSHHDDQVKYKGYHYCNCRKVLMKTGSTLEKVLEAVCPTCRKMIDMKRTIRKGNETIEKACNQILLRNDDDENRRSSTSDNSIDSGYSPDSPMTP